MSRVMYLVAPTEALGRKDAIAKGWTQIALNRFATPDKDDVRVVCRINEMYPTAGKTLMFRGSDYDEGPDSEYELARWLGIDGQKGEKAHFDAFIASGAGEWVDVQPVDTAAGSGTGDIPVVSEARRRTESSAAYSGNRRGYRR